MFNTTKIVDNRTTKQEVNTHTETNIEASGSITKEKENSRFININKSQESFKTIFSSTPFYTEIVQIENGKRDVSIGRDKIYETTAYKTIKTKITVSINQVLVVGSDYTLEVIELNREDVSERFNSDDSRNKYFNIPTII